MLRGILDSSMCEHLRGHAMPCQCGAQLACITVSEQASVGTDLQTGQTL